MLILCRKEYWVLHTNWDLYVSYKTKEMIVCFCKEDDHHANIHPHVINETVIEHVPHAKKLGVTFYLCWNVHTCRKYCKY